jgi:N-formylglutamate amidohydrolase
VSYCNGELPVVLTCAHDGEVAPEGVEPRRNRYQQPFFVTNRDEDARLVVEDLAEALWQETAAYPNVIIAEFSRKFIDANRPRPWAYEQAAASPYWTTYHRHIHSAVRRLTTGLLLDIHGTSRPDADVYLGTAGGTSIANPWVIDFLEGALGSVGYRVALNAPRLGGGYTTQMYGADGEGLDAVQLELFKPLRVEEEKRRQVVALLGEVVVLLLNTYRQAELIV